MSAGKATEVAGLAPATRDAHGRLPRQFCRGCLEQGRSYTVGTLPLGDPARDDRPYWTETLPDGRRFHYCAPCAAERGADTSGVTPDGEG